MKRQLSEQEKKYTRRSIKQLKTELEYLKKVELAKNNLALETADLVFEKQKNDLLIKQRKFKSEINEIEKTLKILEKQMREGVELKENTEVEGGEE